MAESQTSITNMALAHLGISKELASATADASPIGKACRLFYANARDKAFRDFLWPFAMVTADLAGKAANPTTEWAYSYTYPAACARIVRILTDVRPDSRSTRVPYVVRGDGTGGRLIYTDKNDAQLEYVTVIAEAKWPADVVTAVALLLAFLVAPRVAADDRYKLGIRAYQAYQTALAEARINHSSETEEDTDDNSSFLEAR